MHLDALSPDTRKIFEALQTLPGIKNFYLAGGSAIALHFGHRYSHDLDFFSQKRFDSQLLRTRLNRLGKLDTEFVEEDTLLGRLDRTKISFFYYQYPLLARVTRLKGIAVADLKDLAAMKIEAISSRGRKRDFVDLYWILQEKKWDLQQVIGWFKKKYRSSNFNLVHILNSLIYFKDAEAAEDPGIEMIKPVSWQQVKRFFESAVKNYQF